MHFNLQKNKLDFLKNIQGKCKLICAKKSWFLALFGLVLFIFCVYLWNKFVYNPNLSETKKQEYKELNYKEVNFNRNVFYKVLQEINQRKEDYGKKDEIKNDVFKTN
ncbi:MAG: hypothetical protein COU40_00130 [Candidatus Moranbacteria bacterium CG10_big_fil_rev_8_21_14_0_10_35_21]|nr:MAG: hypothetical protein COU40_00130 [Candidatus Moranbacteria bacterium CG10_big_fil_rev_8_21_14_0_10_35_21]PJA88464.1 MAG: hypothetical protein CO139_03095 [Candidatus Moranbacteria bacterium CG_4_9_14_3_um_filter_36_9]